MLTLVLSDADLRQIPCAERGLEYTVRAHAQLETMSANCELRSEYMRWLIYLPDAAGNVQVYVVSCLME